MVRNRLASLMTLVVLVGCGGGGGGGDSVNEAQMGGSIQKGPLLLTGQISPLAGSFNGTDGQVAAARFQWPSVLARHPSSGDVFVADGCVIRRVDLDDYVTTVAGDRNKCGHDDGIGSAATFTSIKGMVVADQTAPSPDYLYVTDRHAIRRVNLSTKEVETIAGNPTESGSSGLAGLAARFSSPQGLALNEAMDWLFIADEGNHTLRFLHLPSGSAVIWVGATGIAGNEDKVGVAARVSSPSALARCGDTLYFSDANGARIRSVDISTAQVSAVAGSVHGSGDGAGASAFFSDASGLACNASNTVLYVADQGNHSVRTVDLAVAAKTVETLAGSTFGEVDGVGTAAQFGSPRDIVFDGARLMVSDFEGATLRHVDPATRAVNTYAGAPRWKDGVADAASFGIGVHAASDGRNLFVADGDNRVIRKIVIATGEVSTLAGLQGVGGHQDGAGAEARFNYPYGITTDGVHLYVTDLGGGAIRKIKADSGEVTTLVPPTWMSNPSDITTDHNNLYVTDPMRHVVYKVDMAGAVSVFAGKEYQSGDVMGTRAEARFETPRAITTDGKSLFMYDASLTRLVKISLTADEVSHFSPSGLPSATSLTSDGTNLYAGAGTQIVKFDIASSIATLLSGGDAGYQDGAVSSARFSSLIGLTTDGESLFVYDGNNGLVRKIQ